MDDSVLPLAMQRLGSSQLHWFRVASTPRFPEAGMNALFLQSDQLYYELPCPGCGDLQPLEWPDNVDMERALLVCANGRCRAPMDVWAEGRWVPGAAGNSTIRGYDLPRLYSPMANMEQMIRESVASTFTDEQAFQNQVLGQVHRPAGGGLSADDLDQCRQAYDPLSLVSAPCDIGIDVGKRLHVVVREHVAAGTSRRRPAGARSALLSQPPTRP